MSRASSNKILITAVRQRKVINIVDNTAVPPTEVNGDRYILDNTGASHANWDGAAANDVVEFNGTNWISLTPEEGYVAYVDALDVDYRFVDDGSPVWEEVPTGGIGSSAPIPNTYADLTALIAAQGAQNTNYIYEVTDGSGFTGVTSGTVWVKYKGTTAGTEYDYSIQSRDNAVSVSPQYITTSGNGCISDADVSLGSTTFGTDNLTALQAILEVALTHPIVVIWDGKYSISGALTIYSNTRIVGTLGAGVVLRNSSNSFVFQNANRVYSSATGGYGSNIIDENIQIENLIINGNGYNTGLGGDSVFDVANGGSAVNGSAQTKFIPMIEFLGVREVYLDNIKLLGGRFWATSFSNVEQVHIKNLDVDFGDSSTRDNANYDGLHFNGYARWISCDGYRIKATRDDSLALNADATAVYDAGYTGPILDANFKNINFYDAVRGIRIQSFTSRVDRLSFENIKGNTTDCVFLIEDFSGSYSGTSDIGSINVKNIDVNLQNDSYYNTHSYFYIDNQNIENLTITDFVRPDFTENYPLLKIAGSSIVESLFINGVVQHSTGGTFASPCVLMESSTVISLSITDYLHREATSKINAEVLKITGGNITNLTLNNISLSNVAKIINHTGGTLPSINATNIKHLLNIDQSFLTTGIVENLVLSNYRSSGNITSGSFTNKWGDGFTHKPSTVGYLPSAAQYQACLLVTDEDGGAVPAFSDGSNWRRVTDRTVVLAATIPVPIGNIVSYWNFDSNSNDQVGTNNGTDTSVSYVGSGLVSNMLDLTGSTSARVLVADDASLSFGNSTTDSAFSISIWVKWDSLANGQLCGKRLYSDNTNKEYHIFYDGTGGNNINFRLFDQSTGGYIQLRHEFTPTVGVWYNIIGTYNANGLSSGLKMYLNSTSVGVESTSGTYTAMENGDGEFIIGPSSSVAQNANNYVDELVVFNKYLSASEATAVYNKGISGDAVNN